MAGSSMSSQLSLSVEENVESGSDLSEEEDFDEGEHQNEGEHQDDGSDDVYDNMPDMVPITGTNEHAADAVSHGRHKRVLEMTSQLGSAPEALAKIGDEMARLKQELYGASGIGGIASELQALQRALPALMATDAGAGVCRRTDDSRGMGLRHRENAPTTSSRAPQRNVSREALVKAFEETLRRKESGIIPSSRRKNKKPFIHIFGDTVLFSLVLLIGLYLGTESFPAMVNDFVEQLILFSHGEYEDEYL